MSDSDQVIYMRDQCKSCEGDGKQMASNIEVPVDGVGTGEVDCPLTLRRPRWKLDLYLLPLLVLGFYVLQLDRSNISNAITDTITTDLGITTDDINLGSQLMTIGIVVAEIPSNLVLQKVGASIWLTGQIGAFGLVSLLQAFCTNKSQFFATRFLLGLTEGGYIPGAQYMLALFYDRHELALRTAIFYFGNYFASATGSLIAAGILSTGLVAGLAGWQRLFIIEGSLTLSVFFLFALFLPRSPDHTRPVHGLWDFFSSDERTAMSLHVISDDSTKAETKVHMTLPSVLRALSDYRLWMHLVLNVVSLAPKGGLALYAPTVIKSLGFTKTKANLLAAVPNFGVVFLAFAISWASDATRLRGPWCILAFVYSIAFAAALYGLPLDSNKWTRYAIFALLNSGNALAQGLNDAWMSINADSAQRRSIGLAFVVMGSNLGSLAGAQLFRSSDAPHYNHAFLAINLLYAASILITLLVIGVYWRLNRISAKTAHTSNNSTDTRRIRCGRYEL